MDRAFERFLFSFVTMPSSAPLVGVFTGNSFSSLSEVSTLDFAEPIQFNDTIYLRSRARFNAIAGTEYAIAVDTADGPGGPFDLAIDVVPHVAITNSSA